MVRCQIVYGPAKSIYSEPGQYCNREAEGLFDFSAAWFAVRVAMEENEHSHCIVD